ncbi:hypothetical protein [Hugonella massiliensis]|jgi:ABC-type transporter Mla subunit MlaD|uniref:hypothetical protein n=1 Tax=Hugonella massiliensis TaxID=1720315 RepID=UPI00073F0926|nr:hypothetical protein [Hugonella massiliensis]MDD6729834.1 dynein gamma chain protein [Eggerthellaceae bacterium]
MCSNGVNTGQYKMMLEQMDDQLAVNRRWMHKLAHLAGDNGYDKTNEIMHQAQALLDDARALMTDAQDALEDDAERLANVQVKLV